MIPQTVHTRFELKASTVKLQKLCEVGLDKHNEQRAWLFATIKQTQAEIRQLKIQLGEMAVPFTALKFRPSNHV